MRTLPTSTGAVALLNLMVLPTLALAELGSGPEIAAAMAERSAGFGDLQADVTMTLTDARGKASTRQLTLRLLERPEEGDLSLLTFDSPAEVAGTALLSHPSVEGADKQWLYLPAVRRAQRISGAAQGSAFVGSEFAYEDVTGASIAKHTWTLTGTAPCGSEQCYELETTANYEGSAYTKRVVQVATESLQPRSIAFYDRKGAHTKTLTYGDYRQVGGQWRAHRWEMVNHATGRSTTLDFGDMRTGTGLAAADFAPTVLK